MINNNRRCNMINSGSAYPNLQRMQEVSAAPIDLAMLRVHLRASHHDTDAYLQQLACMACKLVEGQTFRSVLKKQWSYTHDQVSLFLPYGPIIQNVDHKLSVKIKEGQKFQDLPETEYSIACNNGLGHVQINSKYCHTPVNVTYWAGYEKGALPGSIEHAIFIACVRLYNGDTDKAPVERHLVQSECEVRICT